MIDTVRRLPNRLLVLIGLGLVLVVLAVTGGLRADRDVEIERDQAIEIAKEQVDFEPATAEARVFRQGARLAPVWGVSLSIPGSSGPQEFERLATVEIDARTGEVLRVIDEGG